MTYPLNPRGCDCCGENDPNIDTCCGYPFTYPTPPNLGYRLSGIGKFDCDGTTNCQQIFNDVHVVQEGVMSFAQTAICNRYFTPVYTPGWFKCSDMRACGFGVCLYQEFSFELWCVETDVHKGCNALLLKIFGRERFTPTGDDIRVTRNDYRPRECRWDPEFYARFQFGNEFLCGWLWYLEIFEIVI